jgi:hypothetical protein
MSGTGSKRGGECSFKSTEYFDIIHKLLHSCPNFSIMAFFCTANSLSYIFIVTEKWWVKIIEVDRFRFEGFEDFEVITKD